MRFRVWSYVGSVLTLVAMLATGSACGRFAIGHAVPSKTALRVATSGDYAPFTQQKNGELEGLDIDIARRLGQDLGLKVEFVIVPWSNLLTAMQHGDFDIAMGGVTMRADRALVGRYTRSYAAVGIVALVREAYAKRFSAPDALNAPGVRIAVNAGGHLEQVARAHFPRAKIDAIPDNQAVPQRLYDGRADAVISDTAEARDWVRPGVRVVGPFRFDYKAYLLPADDDELAVRVDDWMVAREADGWLPQMFEQWLGMPAKTNPGAATREAIVALIGLRLNLMVPMAAAKRAAGVAVEDKAREEDVIENVRELSSRPAYTEGVYRQLIELAKVVQRSAPTTQVSPSVAEVRAALGRVDEQLVRELDRAPESSADSWKAGLLRAVTAPGIDVGGLQTLASALATPAS